MAGKPIITIEVANSKNCSVMFGGTSQRLRGRWTASNIVRSDMHDALKRLSEIPVIPGIRIQIDFNERVCRIYDPLKETEEGRKIWKEVSVVMSQFKELFGGAPMQPWDEQRIKNASHSDLKSWLYWMRRLHDIDHAVLVESESNVSEMPSLEKIATLPGRRIRSPFNVSRPHDDPRRYTDEVPVKGAEAAAAG
jgi:hypothetical protein